ncbi:MAG: Protein fmp52, mitochondrial [Vezdaea aestivalis]|nr:MAG: Protein fmp52, mitochondrial [Vezdaea aestivalis]
MASVALVGATGLTGSFILSTLLAQPKTSTVTAFTRRALPTAHTSPKLTTIQDSNTATWPSKLPSVRPQIFISALATTRVDAGGPEAQRKIDLDFNVELARAARDAGSTVYVIISSAGANSSSIFAYQKMKGELEDAVSAMGFEHCVVVRPGLIVGGRDKTRAVEIPLHGFARLMGSVANGLKDFWAQDAEVIGKAAVRAGLDCVEGKRENGVWELGQGDIVRLGRTEWVESKE